MPSNHKDGTKVDEARPIKVELDRTEPDVNIQLVPGRLYHVSGRVAGAGASTVTLISDDGRVPGGAGSGGDFKFDYVAPGAHELEVGQDEKIVGYARIVVDNDKENMVVNTYYVTPVQVSIEEQGNSRVD